MTSSPLTSAYSPRTPSAPAGSTDVSGRDARKWQIAQDFEAMFLHQMFKSMRNTVPTESLTGQESSGRRIFTEMLDEEVARKASRQGGVGLAEMVYKQIAGDISPSFQENTSPKATASDIQKWAQEASQEYGVDESLVRSVIQQESAGNSWAISPKGAKGLMQLMDGTAQEMGVTQIWDGRQNVMGGTRYLKQLLTRFDGNETLALAAYNAGPEAVRMHGGVPPYSETKEYVQNVLANRQKLQQDKEVGDDS